jgi:hypothetical protein
MPPMLPTTPLPINVVTGGMMYMYSCSQCDFKTHVESMFKQHVDSVHLGLAPNNVILGQSVTTLPNVLTSVVSQPQTIVMSSAPNAAAAATLTMNSSCDKLHKCPKCNIYLPSKNQLTQHKRKFHGKVNVAPSAASTPSSASTSSLPMTYTVVTSQSQSSVMASLVSQQSQGHLQGPPAAASGKKTYSCTACGYSTTRRDGLAQHYDSVHLKIKNHQCELCPYAASQKGTLNRHVKLRHKKIKTEVILPPSVSH